MLDQEIGIGISGTFVQRLNDLKVQAAQVEAAELMKEFTGLLIVVQAVPAIVFIGISGALADDRALIQLKNFLSVFQCGFHIVHAESNLKDQVNTGLVHKNSFQRSGFVSS